MRRNIIYLQLNMIKNLSPFFLPVWNPHQTAYFAFPLLLIRAECRPVGSYLFVTKLRIKIWNEIVATNRAKLGIWNEFFVSLWKEK